MKVIIAFLLLIAPAFGQSPTNLYAVGGSYNPGASPAFAGSALYAHAVDASGTYAFTQLDIMPISVKPFSVLTNVGAGVAQRIVTIHKVPIYVPAGAGVSFSGQNVGWQWSGGALASFKVKSFYIMPNVRFLKSSVNGNAGYQSLIPGVLFGWGQ
jgi:hypothetical protein